MLNIQFWRRSAGAILSLLLCGVFGGTALAADERPNVVLILIDDLGRQDLGCYGSKFYRTPNIDKLAQSGAMFSDAYSACPVCSPTRASIMTGKYPARLHLTDWLPGRADNPQQRLLRPKLRMELPLEEVTLAEHLKKAGYVTGHIGKWHLGGKGFGPEEQGFDVNIAGDHTGTPRSYFAPFNGMKGLENAPDGEYLTDRLAAEAEKFIEANQAKPFFLYLPHYAVHTPIRAKKEVQAKYTEPLTPGKQSNPAYAAMVESMDDAVGRVIAKLDALKLRERTLVIFTSDNGGLCTIEGQGTPATINTPLREGKGFLYEGGIRAPLIVSWPEKIKAGQTPGVITSSIDLLPTILELCGAAIPADVDGVSIAGALRGEAALARDAIYWHYPHYANQGSRPSGAIRQGDYKLIEFYETSARELFNLKSDLSESRNIARDKPQLVAELASRLDAWRKSVGAQANEPNPAYRPNPPDKDGVIVMHARTALVTGDQLRYEPLPHKSTLGYWSRQEDTASFDCTTVAPGKYRMIALVGCGAGHGGSLVEFALGETRLSLTVPVTGGFQNFQPQDLGEVAIAAAGRHTLTVTPKTKPGGAVMDLREVRLVPVE